MSLVDLGKVEEALEIRNKALGCAEDTYNWGHVLWSSAKLAETDLPDTGMPTRGCMPSFSFLRPGTVDYGPHKEKILILLEAMNEGRVCRITYGSPYSRRNPRFHIKPLKIFSYRDTLYLYALKAKEPWEAKCGVA